MRKLRIFVILSLSIEVYWRKQKTLFDTAEFRVLRGFVNKGHEVHAIMPKRGSPPRDFSYHGIFIHEFKMTRMPQGKTLLSRLLSSIGQYFDFLSFTFQSTRCCIRISKTYGRPDIAYGYMAGWSTAYVVSRLYGSPNVTRLFGTFLYTSLSSLRDLLVHAQCLDLFAFKFPCEFLIITDDGTRGDEAAIRLGIPYERIKYWMDGADFLHSFNIEPKKTREKLGIPADTHLTISICRLTKWKRIDRLIQAVAAASRMDNDIRLLIVGEGEERENLKLLCDRLGANKSVSFIGQVRHKEIEKYFRAADLFVSLHDFTNLTNSTLEAMACGVCVIALDSGATRRVVRNGKNGILVRHQDLDELPAVLIRLLNDSDLRKRLGNNARQYAFANFRNWDERVAMEVDLIESLTRSRQDKIRTSVLPEP